MILASTRGYSVRCFPRLYAAASLKQRPHGAGVRAGAEFSAALCRGLIEAAVVAARRVASLPFSAALCRGLIEAAGTAPPRARGRASFPRLYAAASLKQQCSRTPRRSHPWFSAALCRGLIEAGSFARYSFSRASGFPRLYAAASLKQSSLSPIAVPRCCFPRLYAAASLKPPPASTARTSPRAVFRGFMPRPH